MKKSTLNKTLLKLLGVLLFVILWQVLSMIIGEDTFIFPSPITTIKQVIVMLKDSYIYSCIGQTMVRMFLGYAIAFGLAFIFGVIAGNNPAIEELLKPTITIFKSVPTATLVYLFLVVAGARLTPLFIVVLVSFPILYESITAGIKSTPADITNAGKLDNSSLLTLNLKIKIPLAFPYIMTGIASSFGLSLKIEIMAEVITGYTRLGLGSAILAAQRSDPTNMVPVFAYSFVAIVIMLIFDFISDKLKEKYARYYIV